MIANLKFVGAIFLALVAVCSNMQALELPKIFNGDDLSGWKVPANNIWWKIHDGILEATSDADKTGSILWTEKEYSNFVMEFEFKMGAGTVDSGIFIRNENEQVQIGISGSLKRDMTASPYIAGKGYPVEADDVKELLEVDGWNQMTIVAIGKQYTTWLNGQQVMTHKSESAADTGPVGVQLHPNRMMSIQFRNIRLAELQDGPSEQEQVPELRIGEAQSPEETKLDIMDIGQLAGQTKQEAADAADTETPINYDESKVPDYTLPDALTNSDGTIVSTPQQWKSKRRNEVLDLFKQHVYGAMPPSMEIAVVQEHGEIVEVLDGKARLSQVSLYFKTDRSGPRLDLCTFLPPLKEGEADGPYPAFLALNFCGNHTVSDEPKIRMHDGWAYKKFDRGGRATKWAIEDVVSRGYALTTLCYGDIDPDHHDGFKNGVHAFFPEYQNRDDNWGSIGAWAWGLSRVLDYFESQEKIDAQKVVVMGHSRLGKTALWAGATDERFALVVSNNSGCGGAALSRRAYGETVARINRLPHWFCENFKSYNGNEAALPVDQHLLISLIAPRPVYVASAEEDGWADPRGEFLSCVGADPVFKLLRTEGLPGHNYPETNSPIAGRIGYHVRTGDHDVTAYDWKQYLDFADGNLKK